MEHYIVGRVDDLLKTACQKAASDVHIEPTAGDGRVRLRINGLLVCDATIEREYVDMVAARLKVLGGMNVTQKRLAQDGKFVYQSVSGPVDIRVSTFPSIFGEKVVLRILNMHVGLLDVKQLGMDQSLAHAVERFLARPTGFFMVTGPTGSGKTTTLYSFLKKLNNQSINIVTLEDPVEYTLEGITQTQINTEIGFTFENGIRSLLRQDPDVIFIGEIRDRATAKTAIEAALTGHLVFTTMHTVDAASAVIRLYDMGIEPFLIEGALSGVVAQRLVRTLCHECKKETEVTQEEYAWFHKIGYTKNIHFQPGGCSGCHMSGYACRVGIFEYIAIDLSFKKILATKPSYELLVRAAVEQNVSFLKHEALRMVEDGITSIHEVLRVITFDL